MSNVENHQSKIQQQFGTVAANYRTSTVHARGVDLAKMVELAPLSGHEHVLDAGCGAGHTALAFAPHLKTVSAYDLTPLMLDQVEVLAAENSITNIQTQQGNVEQLPFPDAEFDLVVSRYSAHHWANPEAALAEFRRVLKPQGQFILSDVVSYSDYTQDTFLQTIELLRDPSHVRDFTVNEWITMLTAGGFEADVALNFDVRLDFQAWLDRMATPPPNREMIRTLLATSSPTVQASFRLPQNWTTQEDFEFVIPGAVFSSTRR
jgi:ubiquinone/menaquinone biosynthesis C-methylase UbiE